MSIRTLRLPTALGATWDAFAWPAKAVGDTLHYAVDAADWLADAGVDLVTATVTHSGDIAALGPWIDDGRTIVTVQISGGTVGVQAWVRVALVLSRGDALQVDVALPIRDDADAGVTLLPSTGTDDNTIAALL